MSQSCPVVNQKEETYRRNTTPLKPVPTPQDPLASGSRKGAKTLLELSSNFSKSVVSSAYDNMRSKYYNAIDNNSDNDMVDEDDDL